MKHLFLPYELAVIAKEKGYDEECFASYREDGSIQFDDPEGFGKWAAPIYQQIIDWLYEEYGIWICIQNYIHGEPTDKLPLGFTFYIDIYGCCEVGESENGYFKTQYDALNKGIEEAFKLI